MRKTAAFAVAIAIGIIPGSAFAGTEGAQGAAPERTDVAYEALTQGRTDDALAQLRDSKAVRAGDPAALINLGTAYARQGRIAEARATFTAAMNSRTQYDLELANGSWIHSREAARRALAGLEGRGDVALR